jgi:SAM-dependent methyltransferase
MNCRPENPAKSRQAPTVPASFVTEYLVLPLGIRSVLDHGTGRSVDVGHYRNYGLDADGFDPHEPFGWWPGPEKHDFDLVMSVYILNVLPTTRDRIAALRGAASYLRPGGYLFVVTRSPKEIEQRRKGKSPWPPHGDGYWSNEPRGMFQRGIRADEVADLAGKVQLHVAEAALDGPPRMPGQATRVLLTR